MYQILTGNSLAESTFTISMHEDRSSLSFFLLSCLLADICWNYQNLTFTNGSKLVFIKSLLYLYHNLTYVNDKQLSREEIYLLKDNFLESLTRKQSVNFLGSWTRKQFVKILVLNLIKKIFFLFVIDFSYKTIQAHFSSNLSVLQPDIL